MVEVTDTVEVGFPASTVVVSGSDESTGVVLAGTAEEVVVGFFGFVVVDFGCVVVVGGGSVVVVVTMTQLMSGHEGYSRRGSSSGRWFTHSVIVAANTTPDTMVARPMRCKKP